MSVSTSPAYAKVQAVRQDLNRVLLEREGAIDNALLALLTKQHYLQVGPPGTAKSMLVEALLARIEGATLFAETLNEGMTDADILGPHDLIAEADHGKHIRRHARSIVEADVAWVDEIGRGNKLIYSLFLQMMDERRRVNEIGMDAPITLPLLSLFAASNSHLLDKHLEALNNRFLLRDLIEPVSSRDSLIRLATNPPKKGDIRATMTLAELREAQAETLTVRGTDEVVSAALELRDALLMQGIRVTDRMWTWSFPLVKAHAWLSGQDQMELEDLMGLRACWWQDPKEAPVVQRAIYQAAYPLAAKALEREDDAMDLLKRLPEKTDPSYEDEALSIGAQLKDLIDTLKLDIRQSRARNKRPAVESLVKILMPYGQLAKQYRGLGRIDLKDVLGDMDLQDLLAS